MNTINKTMSKKVHLDASILNLNEADSESLKCYITKDVVKARRCFVRIKNVSISIQYPQDRIVTLLKTDVSMLDVVNTLAYLRGDSVKSHMQNPLLLKQRRSYISFTTWDSETEIFVKMHKTTLYLIQYGFGCTVACDKNALKALDVPAFPFCIRAICDANDSVFLHGIHSLRRILSNGSGGKREINVRCGRLLPDIFNCIGGKDSMEFDWEDIFYEDFHKDDNRIIRSTLAVIQKPTNYKNQIYLSQEGLDRLKRCPSLPDTIKLFVNTARKTKHGDYVFSLYQTDYYEWFVKTFEKDDKRALSFFLYVYTRSSTKLTISKKRKRLKVDRNWKSKRQIRQVQNSHYKQVNERYIGLHDKGRDGITSLSYFLSFVEVRGHERREYNNEIADPKWHCSDRGQSLCNDTAHWLIAKARDFDPVVQYPKSKLGDTGVASMSFPMLVLNKKVHDKVDEIVGDRKYKYFYDNESFKM